MTKIWQINPDEIKWEEFLNQGNEREIKEEKKIAYNIIKKGGFGEVWKCQWHDTPVAVKKLLLHWVTDAESTKQDFEREITFLRSVRHTNIVLFYGAGNLEVISKSISEIH